MAKMEATVQETARRAEAATKAIIIGCCANSIQS